VALVKFHELSRAWRDALVQLNSRLVPITPTLDRGIVSVIPTDVDSFLALQLPDIRRSLGLVVR
jgi:hypothetical protein